MGRSDPRRGGIRAEEEGSANMMGIFRKKSKSCTSSHQGATRKCLLTQLIKMRRGSVPSLRRPWA
jgi:hypothetical protein